MCPTFTNVYWDLDIKKFRASNGGPLNRGAPCHGITGILVNPALALTIRSLITTLDRAVWISSGQPPSTKDIYP